MQLSKPLIEVTTFLFPCCHFDSLKRFIISSPFFCVTYLRILQAIIHLESLLPSPKRLEYVDSLVEKFITPNPDNPNAASTADREDLSSIYLEVSKLLFKNPTLPGFLSFQVCSCNSFYDPELRNLCQPRQGIGLETTGTIGQAGRQR